MSILGEEQAGFRKGYSTVDHIFTLKCLIDLYLQSNKKLFCCFIDYRKAYDSVSRNLLWSKLLSYNINGKILNVIKNIYDNAKSCVRVSDNLSHTFQCKVGVRQGENLSPLLFSLFLNDLETYMNKVCDGSPFVSNLVELLLETDDIVIYLKLFLLLYADDTIIFAESAEKLQVAMNCLDNYCKLWKLKINIDKTKVVIFSKGKIRNIPKFSFNNIPVEVVFNYKYLGILFNYNGTFTNALKSLCDQASKALIAVNAKIKKLSLPVDMQLELFDSVVKPILLYGCDVWGFHDCKIIERFHLKFLKNVLKVKPSTPSIIVYGELGRNPLLIDVKVKMLCFWCKLVTGNRDKLSYIMYKLMLELHLSDIVHSNWILCIKNILIDIGEPNIWFQQFAVLNWLKSISKIKLRDLFIQRWLSSINECKSCSNYRIFKKDLTLEKYLIYLPLNLKRAFCNFRTTNNRFPVHSHINGNNICQLCNIGSIGDEFHYLFVCDHFNNTRKVFLPKYYQTRPNCIKFCYLLQTNNKKLLLKISKLCKVIIDTLNNNNNS